MSLEKRGVRPRKGESKRESAFFFFSLHAVSLFHSKVYCALLRSAVLMLYVRKLDGSILSGTVLTLFRARKKTSNKKLKTPE